MPLITVRGREGPPVSHRFEKDTITVGRGPQNDLILNHGSVSREHVLVWSERQEWFVSDCKSRNGTLLNGRAVAEPTRLAAGDQITVGETTLIFEPTGALTDGGDPPTMTVRTLDTQAQMPGIVGRSAPLRAALNLVQKVAGSDETVLIRGERGTGKELIAQLLHRLSARSAGPLVVVNCPALPGSLLETELFGVEKGVATGVQARPGRVEMANGGTLFLDEIGDIDLAAQAKLLRFLQEKTIERVGGRKPIQLDMRVLAATNHDLEADVRKGAFRGDLYDRLNVVTVSLPPLRERRDDIPLLIEHFLSRAAGPFVTMSPDAVDLLMRYGFPGNVRELEHLMTRLRLLVGGAVVLPKDLPEEMRRGRAEPTETNASETARDLYDKIVHGGESFWTVVQRPFLRRLISRDDVRRLIERGYQEAGGSYKEMASLFRIEHDYKKLLTFLDTHDLGIKKGPTEA